ncbi:unnamed protein product [Brachionus calyciflorus]|uniref:Uncharacterized protein n=1 Tax=Brachionus calyciflorus TaxID=104777 RepID=A0A814KUF6_9BILA|nr:unnamed protein product [Brachionus calyciflorus]
MLKFECYKNENLDEFCLNLRNKIEQQLKDKIIEIITLDNLNVIILIITVPDQLQTILINQIILNLNIIIKEFDFPIQKTTMLIIIMTKIKYIIYKIQVIKEMGGIKNQLEETLPIESQYQIKKVGSRTFTIGNLTIDKNLLLNLIDLIDLGSKFIPNYYSNYIDIFTFMLYSLNDSLFDFNKKIFFKLQMRSNMNDDRVSTPNIPYISDCLNFELEILKNLNDIKLDLNKNIPSSKLSTLNYFCKNKPVKIVECDKNVGFAILNNQLYDQLCDDHLNNNKYYKEIFEDPLVSSIELINKELEELFTNEDISSSLFYSLVCPTNS